MTTPANRNTAGDPSASAITPPITAPMGCVPQANSRSCVHPAEQGVGHDPLAQRDRHDVPHHDPEAGDGE